MESKFNLTEVLKTSWKRTKEQIWVLMGLFIGYMILQLILSFLFAPGQGSTTALIISNLVSSLLSVLFGLGYYKNMFQALDGEEPQFSAYGQQAKKLFTFLIASILYSLIILIGFLCLIVPGLYLIIRLQFFTAFIVEENAGIIDSLKRSWEITRGEEKQLALLLLLTICLIILGIILFFVGVFVAIPLIIMMQCYVFRKLNTFKTKQETLA